MIHDWFVRQTEETKGKECGSVFSSRSWGGALRDKTKNGCVGDYECTSGANIGKPSCSTAHVNEAEVYRVVTFDWSTQTYLPPVPEGYSNTEAQTEEFDYMFTKPGYTAPTQEYFDSSGKVRFYTRLPSYDILLILFEHVAPCVPRHALSCKSS